MRSRILGIGLVGATILACTGSPDAGLADTVSKALAADAARVLDRLAESGIDVTPAALADAPVNCPPVADPSAGDRTTCQLDVGGDVVGVEVEFGSGGSLRIVNLVVLP